MRERNARPDLEAIFREFNLLQENSPQNLVQPAGDKEKEYCALYAGIDPPDYFKLKVELYPINREVKEELQVASEQDNPAT